MKKIKLDSKRLHLKKEKIASLTKDQMSRVMGGVVDTDLCDPRGCTDPDINTVTRDLHSCPPVGTLGTCATKCGLTDIVGCVGYSADIICIG